MIPTPYLRYVCRDRIGNNQTPILQQWWVHSSDDLSLGIWFDVAFASENDTGAPKEIL